MVAAAGTANCCPCCCLHCCCCCCLTSRRWLRDARRQSTLPSRALTHTSVLSLACPAVHALRPQTQCVQLPQALHGTVKSTSVQDSGWQHVSKAAILWPAHPLHHQLQYPTTPAAGANDNVSNGCATARKDSSKNRCKRPVSQSHLERTPAASLHRPTHHPSHSRCCSSGRQSPAHCCSAKPCLGRSCCLWQHTCNQHIHKLKLQHVVKAAASIRLSASVTRHVSACARHI